MSGDEQFLQKLRATFRVEAREHLQAIGAGLLAVERAANATARQSQLEIIFRAAHSLKGAARAVDFGSIEARCTALENLFAGWRRAESAPESTELDAAHRALDEITRELAGALPVEDVAPRSETNASV